VVFLESKKAFKEGVGWPRLTYAQRERCLFALSRFVKAARLISDKNTFLSEVGRGVPLRSERFSIEI
jgi:hypothetical protein